MGILDSIRFSEGDFIQKNDIIGTVVSNQNTIDGKNISDSIISKIENQIKSVENEIKIKEKIYNNEIEQLSQKKKLLDIRKEVLNETKKTNVKRLTLKSKLLEDNKKLNEKGFITESDLFNLEDEYLIINDLVNRIDDDLVSIEIDIKNIESQVENHPFHLYQEINELKRDISTRKAQLMRIKDNYEFFIRSPRDGIITTIQANVGSNVDIDDEVNIRFDAFPYQKFGITKGKIVSIDQDVILPSDNISRIIISEPMYRVKVKLNKQRINIYGKEISFKVGMKAEADIVLDTRTIFEWLLEPIYSIKWKFV